MVTVRKVLPLLNVANMFPVLGLSLLTDYALVYFLRILFQFVERLSLVHLIQYCFGSFTSVFELTLFMISYALFGYSMVFWFICLC